MADPGSTTPSLHSSQLCQPDAPGPDAPSPGIPAPEADPCQPDAPGQEGPQPDLPPPGAGEPAAIPKPR